MTTSVLRVQVVVVVHSCTGTLYIHLLGPLMISSHWSQCDGRISSFLSKTSAKIQHQQPVGYLTVRNISSCYCSACLLHVTSPGSTIQEGRRVVIRAENKSAMVPQAVILLVLLQCCMIFPPGYAFIASSSLAHRSKSRPSSSVLYKRPWMRSTRLGAAIAPGDTVLVVGGTGGVGQLVTSKLLPDYQVRVTSRDKERGEETIGTNEIKNLQVMEFDLISGSDAQLQEALQGVSALVISVGTTAFPTMKWRGGNTPEAIDKVAVERLAEAASKIDSVKRIVLLTSVGVDRTDEMPFVVLNLFGVLDAKKAGEEAVKATAAKNPKIDYAIVRPGRLVGGPFTNLDVARLMQIEGGAENGVDVAAGDALLGDCKRDACAEAVVQCLVNAACQNVEFSIVSNDDKALNEQQWTEAFQKMK